MKKYALSVPLFLAALSFQTAHADVSAQVLQIQMKQTEQDVTSVQLAGLVRNTEKLPVRGVQVRIQLLDPQNQPVRSFLLDPFDHMESGQTERFSADYLLRDYNPGYLKATAEVSYTPTSYLQIADWLLTQNWTNLAIWRVPVTDAIKTEERARLESALSYLEQVERYRPEYAEARRKWNLVQYTYGKRLAEAHDLHEAILRLANVEDHSAHAAEAQQLTEEVRLRAIYERALAKALSGNLRGAYRQLLYIPATGPYAQEAATKREAWLKMLKEQRINMSPENPPAGLSSDQRSLWLRRKQGPEGKTTTVREDGSRLTTWWYLDYSHYSFDERGRLVNKQEYK